MHILQNLVEMTEQRDHLRLDLSVLSTFLQLPNVIDVRALEIQEFDQAWFLRPLIWLNGQTLVTSTSNFSSDPARIALQSLPALQTCIDQRHSQSCMPAGENQHVLWLPVWQHDRVKICFEITQSHTFCIQSLAVITGVFNVYRNYQSLLDYSERDALTGLLNRKTFDEHLLRFARPTATQNTPLSPWLAVIDIDHFKQVNDKFGHLFGDEVLILTANLLRTAFNSEHRIFRFGGEEFVVLLAPMAAAQALACLESFRDLMAQHSFPQVGQVTVSLGFAGTRLCSPVEILGHADQALYYAKEHGRNRVCQYELLQAQGLLGATAFSHADAELL